MKLGMLIRIIAALSGCMLFSVCAACQAADTIPPVVSETLFPIQAGNSSGSSANPMSGTLAAYGVFLGLNPEDMERLSGYSLVVIDAVYYTEEHIAQMHEAGQQVYTYINVGSVEQFRDYYSKYESITLGVYEDWPNERWVDVSREEWQEFVTDTLAASLAKKSVDGFFLDNADVYYMYPREEIYQGLLSILNGLEEYGLPLIVNGGDTFVTKLIEDGKPSMIDGVNQESVFTSIDFDHNMFGFQDTENHHYYLEYLSLCKQQGLSVYLLEYASNPQTVEPEIAAYCAENSFMYYISDDLELDG